MKRQILLLLVLVCSAYVHAQDIIYFDKDWNQTTKDKSVYYQPMPLPKVGDLVFVRDYYTNGQMQFQGYMFPNNEDKYVGDAFWYDENGLDESSVQFINLSKQKELTYYYNDGSVWKKVYYNKDGSKSKIVVYHKGKELIQGLIDKGVSTGYFTPSGPKDMYINPFNENRNDDLHVDNKFSSLYYNVLYWENGVKAFEKKKEKGSELKKYWDDKGKLIYNSLSNKSKSFSLNYYLKNGFAVGIKFKRESSETDQGYLRIESTYDIDGYITSISKYLEGDLIEQIGYKDGSETVLKYQNEQPYDGAFDYRIGKFNRVYKMISGMMVGEAITKDAETNEVLTKGDYVDGVPNNGTFFVENKEGFSILTFKNKIQDGLQQKFKDFWEPKLVEESHKENGKIVGEYKKVDDGKVIITEYRDGLPYEGIVSIDDITSHYKEGNLVRKDSFDVKNHSLLVSENYESNKLVSKLYFFFAIFDDPKDFYEGVYKDGMPFDGYFVEEYGVEGLKDIPLIGFYEKGILKHRYTTHLFKSKDDFNRIFLDKKASFVNGKLVNGFEYVNMNRDHLFGVGFKETIPYFLELNLFAMNYFNQFILALSSDKLEFREYRSGITIRTTSREDNSFTEVLNYEGKVLQSSKSYFVKEGSPNSVTLYALNNGHLVSFHYNENQLSELNELSEYKIDKVTLLFYSYLLNNPKQNLTEIFDVFLKEFSKDDILDVLDSEIPGLTFNNFIGRVYYNKEGKPYEGLIIEKVDDGFKVKAYDEGVLKETKNAKDLKEIKKISMEFYFN